MCHGNNLIPFLFNRLFWVEYVKHPINVEVKTCHFMIVWVVGQVVICYIDEGGFSVDVQLEFVVFRRREMYHQLPGSLHPEKTQRIPTELKSAYATHILDNRHEFGTSEETLKLLKSCSKGQKMNCWETLYMQIHRKLNILISEQLITQFNPLYDLAYTPRDLQPYSYPWTNVYSNSPPLHSRQCTQIGKSNIRIITSDM